MLFLLTFKLQFNNIVKVLVRYFFQHHLQISVLYFETHDLQLLVCVTGTGRI